EDAQNILIRSVQQECFPELMNACTQVVNVPDGHNLSSLAPFIDRHGMLRVGGRLQNSTMPLGIKCPLVVPEKHPISVALIRHFHTEVQHQGSYITHRAIRMAGFHIQRGTSLIKRIISECVLCRKLRAKLGEQEMADLPSDRARGMPPFSNVGLDVFGPYQVVEGKSTRRSNSQKKLWALLFTCLVSRAIHVEPLPALDTSSFKNAFRRFIAIRGPCKIIRSDRGTNFLGAHNQDEE
ncbi:Ribonuclease H-like domain, partial [Trinorchestia longiramus]